MAMICVIADNMEYRNVVEKEFLFQTINSGAYAVDTFFFIRWATSWGKSSSYSEFYNFSKILFLCCVELLECNSVTSSRFNSEDINIDSGLKFRYVILKCHGGGVQSEDLRFDSGPTEWDFSARLSVPSASTKAIFFNRSTTLIVVQIPH